MELIQKLMKLKKNREKQKEIWLFEENSKTDKPLAMLTTKK